MGCVLPLYVMGNSVPYCIELKQKENV